MSIDLAEQTTSHEKQRSLRSLKTDTIRVCTVQYVFEILVGINMYLNQSD